MFSPGLTRPWRRTCTVPGDEFPLPHARARWRACLPAGSHFSAPAPQRASALAFRWHADALTCWSAVLFLCSPAHASSHPPHLSHRARPRTPATACPHQSHPCQAHPPPVASIPPLLKYGSSTSQQMSGQKSRSSSSAQVIHAAPTLAMLQRSSETPTWPSTMADII